MERSSENLSPYRQQRVIILVSAVMFAVGAIGLGVGFAVAELDTWLWLVVDFLIFSGIANGALMWAVTFRLARARWTPAINRLSHSTIAFVPVVAAALWALAFGVRNYVPWAGGSYPKQSAYLNATAFAAREIAGLAVLWGILLFLVYLTLKSDAVAREQGKVPAWIHTRISGVSLAAAMVYSIVSTIIAIDFVMSLSPKWVTTVFGAYFFTTNLYVGLAVIVLLATVMRKRLGIEDYLKPQQFKDLGNLMLGFSLFNMGLFFAQYLTIWYENLPNETFFLIARYLRGPWSYVGWASFMITYAAPFVVLQSRYVKLHPKLLSAVAALAISGFALERYVMVVPSIFPHRLMLYPVGVLGLLLFSGAFVFGVTWFLSRYSPVSSADAALKEFDEEEEVTV